jgi:methylmalonyl-CoA mutase N-terminal domain/subunit
VILPKRFVSDSATTTSHRATYWRRVRWHRGLRATGARPTRDRGQARLHRGRRSGLEAELPGEFPPAPVPDDVPRAAWTIRQYAGFGSAEETNARFRTAPTRPDRALDCVRPRPSSGSIPTTARGREVGRTGSRSARSPTWSCSSTGFRSARSPPR